MVISVRQNLYSESVFVQEVEPSPEAATKFKAAVPSYGRSIFCVLFLEIIFPVFSVSRLCLSVHFSLSLSFSLCPLSVSARGKHNDNHTNTQQAETWKSRCSWESECVAVLNASSSVENYCVCRRKETLTSNFTPLVSLLHSLIVQQNSNLRIISEKIKMYAFTSIYHFVIDRISFADGVQQDKEHTHTRHTHMCTERTHAHELKREHTHTHHFNTHQCIIRTFSLSWKTRTFPVSSMEHMTCPAATRTGNRKMGRERRVSKPLTQTHRSISQTFHDPPEHTRKTYMTPQTQNTQQRSAQTVARVVFGHWSGENKNVETQSNL